jgi:hypothetical protein
LRYIHTLFSFCATTTLIVTLGTSCANDNTDKHDFTASKYDNATPETRAARMRKALRETSEGQETRQKIAESAFKQTQNLLDERGLGETITEKG